MPTAGKSILTQVRRKDYQRILAIKFAMLMDHLRGLDGCGRSLVNHLQSTFTYLDHIRAEFVVEKGTPFFWMNVNRLYSSSHNRDSDLQDRVRFLLMTAFDAFFQLLPTRIIIDLPTTGNMDLVFPRLGIMASGIRGATKLIKLSGSQLKVESEGMKQSLLFDLKKIDPMWKIPKIPIPGNETAVLLLAKHPALFETDYIEKIYPLTPNFRPLAQLIGQSLELIRDADDVLFDKICRLTKWYVPIFSSSMETHNSFTASNLSGVMFLSEAYDDTRLAEAIVHEYHHDELYLLMEIAEIFDPECKDFFYSPWRDDPRPLVGLFHALYVFSAVLDFLGRAESLPLQKLNQEKLLERRWKIFHQLRMGLAQVPDKLLSPLGRTIIQSIKDSLLFQEESLGVLKEDLPTNLQHHLSKWCEANPSLALRVRFPS